jgi:cell wall-associated NlpC family hydrolase
MRVRLLVLAALALLAFAAPAAGAGPVFVVVSGDIAPDPPQQPALAADDARLAELRSAEARAARAYDRAEALASSDKLLSDQIQADQVAFGYATAMEQDRAAIAQTEQAVATTQADAAAYTPAPFAPYASGSELGVEAVAIAEQFLGVPYVWGGASPSTGFDCSGLVQYVYGQLGISLPHYAASQWAQTTHVDPSQLQPGDLLFFEPRSDGPGHVGIYVGGDTFVEAPHTGDVVKLASFTTEARDMGFVGAARPYPSFG